MASLDLSTTQPEMNWSDTTGKALTTGAIGGALMEIAYRGQDTDMRGVLGQYLGTRPIYVAGAAAGIISSLTADAFHDIVVPYISRDEKFSQISSGLVGAGTAAGSTALAYYALDPMFLSPQGVGAF